MTSFYCRCVCVWVFFIVVFPYIPSHVITEEKIITTQQQQRRQQSMFFQLEINNKAKCERESTRWKCTHINRMGIKSHVCCCVLPVKACAVRLFNMHSFTLLPWCENNVIYSQLQNATVFIFDLILLPCDMRSFSLQKPFNTQVRLNLTTIVRQTKLVKFTQIFISQRSEHVIFRH